VKTGPIHLILDPNDRLMCAECGTLLFNTVAFIRGRTINDYQGNVKYRVGVVLCGTCEPKVRSTEREATLDNNG
jgi:hypothetical protein